MNDARRSAFHDLLGECYEVQQELEDLRESYEILICDIELAVEEINENLKQVRNHLQKVENIFAGYNHRFQQDPKDDNPEKLPKE